MSIDILIAILLSVIVNTIWDGIKWAGYKNTLINKAKNHETEFINKTPIVLVPESDYLNLRMTANKYKQLCLKRPNAFDITNYDEIEYITYTNYKGKTSERRILPIRVWFGSTEYHPDHQMMLTAYDVDKQAERDFAVKDIIYWNGGKRHERDK